MGIEYNQRKDVFEFNFTSNSKECLVEFVDLPLEPVLLDDVEGMSNVYYFGYEFLNNDYASSKIRSKFLHELRFNDNFTTQENKELFIKTALSKLKKALNITINDIGIIIYPKSRSSLNDYILKLFYALTNSKAKSFEVIKKLPQHVQFNWEEFRNNELESFVHGRSRYTEIQKQQQIEKISKLMDEIHSLEYFSIAENVRTNKYKSYFADFFYFDSPEMQRHFCEVQEKDDKILILDDISTTGATLKEIIKIVRFFNKKSDIILFTLIGKKSII
jgi:hypoxanthine phosphoribosyltransferase